MYCQMWLAVQEDIRVGIYGMGEPAVLFYFHALQISGRY